MMRKGFLKKRLIKSGMAIALSAVMSVNVFGATNLNVNVKTAFNKGEYGEYGFKIVEPDDMFKHNAIQNMEIVGDSVYMTARRDADGDGQKDDLAIMLFKIGKDNVARYSGKTMTIIDGGHGETLDSYVYKNNRYFVIGVKALREEGVEEKNQGYFASQIAFVRFKAGDTLSYKKYSRITNLNYIGKTNSSRGKVIRTAASVAGKDLNIRVALESGDKTKYFYAVYDLNAILDKCLDQEKIKNNEEGEDKKGLVEIKELSDSNLICKEGKKNTVYGSFQGMESYGKNIYLSSGQGNKTTPQAPAISKYNEKTLNFDKQCTINGTISDDRCNDPIDIAKCEVEGICSHKDNMMVLLAYTYSAGTKYYYVVPVDRF